MQNSNRKKENDCHHHYFALGLCIHLQIYFRSAGFNVLKLFSIHWKLKCINYDTVAVSFSSCKNHSCNQVTAYFSLFLHHNHRMT